MLFERLEELAEEVPVDNGDKLFHYIGLKIQQKAAQIINELSETLDQLRMTAICALGFQQLAVNAMSWPSSRAQT